MNGNEDLTLQQILIEALEDEYKAQARYREIIDKFGPVQPFVNIVEAEGRHISVLVPLFERYGIPLPEEPEEPSIRVPDTLLEACKEGVEAETENVALYDRLIAAAREADVSRVLRNLQSASRDRHLPAFQRCVERAGGSGPNDPQCTGDQRRTRKGWSKK